MYRYSNSNRTKRRRVIPVRPKRDTVPDPSPPIFENTRVYIHPYNINGSRRKVLHNLIRKNGGSYTLVPDAETTHVLVDEGVSSGKLCRSLGWTTFPPNINVLMVSWLSASVRASRCLNPVDYEIPCTHRPTFATSHHCVTSESTAATGPADNECIFSDASSSSVLSAEDADAEMPNFGYVYEEGSTYDDGKYDEETSCDDEWLCERPIIPSKTCGIVNPFNPNPCGMFPTNSFSSTSNLRSLVSTPHLKKPKLEDVPPSSRPNTLAAQLSRVRVRRIPEHLRVPGGRSVIVDLNKENFPQPSSKNIAYGKTIKQRDSNIILNGAETSSTDERCNVRKVQNNPCAPSKIESTQHADKSFSSHLDKDASVCKYAHIIHFPNQSTQFSTEISEDKSKKSVTVFSPDEKFDVESVNEVSQVLTMIVESVYEVAVNEKIINESVVEISKNAMENDDSADETLKNENVCTELVSDILLKLVEDVAKAETDEKFKIIKVESLNKNVMHHSDTYNPQKMVKISKDISNVENKVKALKEETPMEIEELSTCEPFKETSQENRCTELVEVESAISELPVSQLPIITDISPYPVRLFCSATFDSSALDIFSDDQMKREPVECITAEISHPSNREPLECEVATNSNASYRTSESEVINQTRSCGRPDISGPNIFFPFPISSSSAPSSSLHPHNSDNPGSASPLFGACHSPNSEIIKILQLLYESFKRTGEKWRVDVYEKAIFSLAKYPKTVESLEEIQSLNGMSKTIAQKIWLISQTGHLKEFDEICARQSEETRKLFSRAWGISPRMARKLYKEGYYTLSDLWTKSSLSRSHFVGLRYYEDLKTKMSKKEATRIFLTVLKVIFEKYPDVQCDACSSLRRNKKFCGHVSILVTLPKGCDKNDHRVLPDIVAKLHQLGYLVDDLIRHEENGEQTRYVGIFKLGASFKYRRIEITVCTREEYACAILFLTGSSYFNRAIHQWAIKREMVLDEHSLRIRLLNTSGGTDAVTRLHTPDEKTIFSFLQLPYRTPEQRDRFIM
ncbi:unnamed protein product [Larinioides sclopetarius]|uniref:DNA polymerase lambda n=1 Tax=Larinioides sclopetarius TaxID=280406 RepID=A0AAV1Z7V0_9ARAC